MLFSVLFYVGVLTRSGFMSDIKRRDNEREECTDRERTFEGGSAFDCDVGRNVL